MSFAEGVADHLEGRVLAERYRVGRRIGRGGMGSVYDSEHIGMKRRVALKVLRPELALDPTMVKRFEREAQAASRIESPHVVTLYDFGSTSDGLLFIAMELLDGASLRARLDAEGALPLDEALRVALGIARALEAAHAVGVVHRDLKPDNVMLCADGRVLVLDFGIAKVMDPERITESGEQGALTEVGAIVGTPMYMSPEAVGRKRVGPQADLYALGVILFEILVGRRPFDDKEPVLLMGMHLRVPPELVRDARPDLAIPDALEDLVDRLLAKEPLARPESAGAVVAELAGLRRAPSSRGAARPVEGPIATVPTSSGGSLPWGLLLGAGALVGGLGIAGIVGVVVLWSGGDSTETSPPTHRGPASVAPIDLRDAASTRPDASHDAGLDSGVDAGVVEDLVEIRIDVRPRNARLFWDGQRIEGTSIRVPRSEERHTLRATARDHVTLNREIAPFDSQTIELRLRHTPWPSFPGGRR